MKNCKAVQKAADSDGGLGVIRASGFFHCVYFLMLWVLDFSNPSYRKSSEIFSDAIMRS